MRVQTDTYNVYKFEELDALLTARLPGLIAEFHADMDRAGFIWEP